VWKSLLPAWCRIRARERTALGSQPSKDQEACRNSRKLVRNMLTEEKKLLVNAFRKEMEDDLLPFVAMFSMKTGINLNVLMAFSIILLLFLLDGKRIMVVRRDT